MRHIHYVKITRVIKWIIRTTEWLKTRRWHGKSWLLDPHTLPPPSLHPDEVEEPFREGLRALLPKVNCRLGLVMEEPLIGFETCGKWGCGDWRGVLGLGSGDEVDGAPAGLQALSLAESLSERLALLRPSWG